MVCCFTEFQNFSVTHPPSYFFFVCVSNDLLNSWIFIVVNLYPSSSNFSSTQIGSFSANLSSRKKLLLSSDFLLSRLVSLQSFLIPLLHYLLSGYVFFLSFPLFLRYLGHPFFIVLLCSVPHRHCLLLGFLQFIVYHGFPFLLEL